MFGVERNGLLSGACFFYELHYYYFEITAEEAEKMGDRLDGIGALHTLSGGGFLIQTYTSGERATALARFEDAELTRSSQYSGEAWQIVRYNNEHR